MGKEAKTDHPINELIARRWSPYGFDSRPVSDEDLRSIFEAARWAASSYNEQPWRYLVARKQDGGEYDCVLSCLTDQNQAWAKNAPVLGLGLVSLFFKLNGKPNRVAVHDLGLASATLSLEATARGLYVHQMAGIVPERVRETYSLPQGIEPMTALAIGYRAQADTLPEEYRKRDTSPRTRNKLGEFVFTGKLDQPAAFLG